MDELNPKQNAPGKLGTKIKDSIFDPNNEEQVVATPYGYGTLQLTKGKLEGRVDDSTKQHF